MNLKQTKEHILRVSDGHPEVMQQAALQVLDKKIEDELIKRWAVENKDEIVKFNQFRLKHISLAKYFEMVELIKKKSTILSTSKDDKHTLKIKIHSLNRLIEQL